jgi:hypothetical protein
MPYLHKCHAGSQVGDRGIGLLMLGLILNVSNERKVGKVLSFNLEIWDEVSKCTL